MIVGSYRRGALLRRPIIIATRERGEPPPSLPHADGSSASSGGGWPVANSPSSPTCAGDSPVCKLIHHRRKLRPLDSLALLATLAVPVKRALTDLHLADLLSIRIKPKVERATGTGKLAHIEACSDGVLLPTARLLSRSHFAPSRIEGRNALRTSGFVRLTPQHSAAAFSHNGGRRQPAAIRPR
jgi:hypothetical protein